MNGGWLCDSTLKAAHQSSPMSTTPAFSPGGTMTRSPVVGSLLRCMREDLYEQCSDHITEKIPSSVSDGSRPSTASSSRYSSALRPCSATSSGDMFWRGLFMRELRIGWLRRDQNRAYSGSHPRVPLGSS